MNFFIDFEATQPEQEIISIGAVCENGSTYHAYIKPIFSEVSPYITELTGITSEMLRTNGLTMDTAFQTMWRWMKSQCNNVLDWAIFSYGNSDKDFIKASMKACESEDNLLIMSYYYAHIQDYSSIASKYFHGKISLIHAYNYIKATAEHQKHNASEDANMLWVVFQNINGKEPLDQHPLRTECGDSIEHIPTDMGLESLSYNKPHGVFYARHKGKNQKELSFNNIDDAVSWLIYNKIEEGARSSVHRDRVMKHIMKAVKKPNDTYMDFHWRRIKETKNDTES